MRRKSFKTLQCPVARSLERVGEWWSILILRDAFLGTTRFDQFLESLDIAPESVASASEPGGPSAAQDAPSAIETDPAACQREAAELNRLRATPDLSDAKRFASTVTCGALRPQVARLLESFGE